MVDTSRLKVRIKGHECIVCRNRQSVHINQPVEGFGVCQALVLLVQGTLGLAPP